MGLATNVVKVLLTGPGLKVTEVLTVAPAAVPVTVLISALVELKVAVNTPALLVVPVLGVSVLLEPLLLTLTV